jgi:FkbM family methyltransferase
MPTKSVRGKWHGYWMDLNLSDWSERQTFFLARYHELGAQLLIDRCVRSGDRFVDVGANIGMLTLHAAARVGANGVVDAFEPNPTCYDRVRATLERNHIRHVRPHEVALSDAAGSLTLSVLQNHTGMGTLACVSDRAGVTSTVNVPVKVADAILLADERPIALVKIDVEGFEVRVLRGMTETLRRFKPIVATEVIAEWLERAGSGVGELIRLMEGLGYRGFGLTTRRRGLHAHSLELVPFPAPGTLPPGIFDVVWIPGDGQWASRLEDLVPRA